MFGLKISQVMYWSHTISRTAFLMLNVRRLVRVSTIVLHRHVSLLQCKNYCACSQDYRLSIKQHFNPYNFYKTRQNINAFCLFQSFGEVK